MLSSHVKNIISSKKFKYLVVGGWNTVFGYFVTIALFYLLRENFNIVQIGILSNILGISMSFSTYKIFVFKTKGNWLKEYIKSYLVYGISAIISIFLLWVLIELLELNIWIAQALSMITTVILSYIGHKNITFNDSSGTHYNRHINYWYLLLCVECVFVIYAVLFFKINAYLPPPFFYVIDDTYMDFFHTNFWAYNEDRYIEWKSIYPVFIFLISKLITLEECAYSTSFYLRACSISSIYYLFLSYFIGVLYCTAIIAKEVLRKEETVPYLKIFCAIFMVILFNIHGFYALERGNYVVVAFMLLSMAIYYNKKIIITAILMTLVINIKQYLILLIYGYFLKKQTLKLLVVFFSISLPSLIALLFIREDYYGFILRNMTDFSSSGNMSKLQMIFNTVSIDSFRKFLTNPVVNSAYYENNKLIFNLTIAISIIAKMVSLGVILLLFIKNNILKEDFILFSILVALFVFTDSPGAYSTILLLPFVGSLIKLNNNYILISLFLVFIPLEFPFIYNPGTYIMESFLSSETVEFRTYLTLGSLLRPVFMMILLFCLFFYLLQLKKGTRNEYA